MFFNFCIILLKMYLVEIETFFLVLYFSSQLSFVSGSSNVKGLCFWWSIFSSLQLLLWQMKYLFFHSFPWQPWLSWQIHSVHQYHSVYGWQTWQDGSYLDWLPPIKLLNSLITWSCKMTWQTKISTAMRMTTKLGKMVTPLVGLLPIKSNFPLMQWSC